MKTTIRHFLTIVVLFFSSSSFSAQVYSQYVSGAWRYDGSTPAASCEARQAVNTNTDTIWTYGNNVSGWWEHTCHARRASDNSISSGTQIAFRTTATCPASVPYEWDDGICYAQEQVASCPDGQLLENNVCTAQCVKDAQITLTMQFEDVQQKITDPILGCKLEMSPGAIACNSLMSSCNITYTDTGVYDDTFAYENGEAPEPIPPVEPAPEPLSTETTTGPVVDIQQNPDGSTTKTETTETTKLNDQGQTIELIGDSIVLKNKDGEIIDILQQTTTNTYTDGSKSVTETITTTATPSSVTEVKKNITDGSTTTTTRTYQSGPSGTTVTTKTETFDAEGNSTGKTESTTGKIDEAGEEEEGDYSYQSPGGKDDLYEKSGKTFQGVLTNFVDEAQQAPVFSAASGFFTVSTGGTCPTWTIPATWVFSAMVIDAQCSQVMNQIWPLIAAIVLAVAGYVAFRWAFL